jgi:hypothetical protein
VANLKYHGPVTPLSSSPDTHAGNKVLDHVLYLWVKWRCSQRIQVAEPETEILYEVQYYLYLTGVARPVARPMNTVGAAASGAGAYTYCTYFCIHI